MTFNIPSNTEILRLSCDVTLWLGLLHLYSCVEYNKVEFCLCTVFFLTWMTVSIISLKDG